MIIECFYTRLPAALPGYAIYKNVERERERERERESERERERDRERERERERERSELYRL